MSSVIAVSNLTAEWINNITLRVKWKPIQVMDGVSAVYTVNYSPILGSSDGLQSVSDANGAELQMSTTTQMSSVVIDNLDPKVFYNIYIGVMVHLNQIQDPSVAISELSNMKHIHS